MRQIMAEVGGLKTSELQAEDKVAYKDIVRGKKPSLKKQD